jgi:16S rRNA (adenine1518-N6/adenine1519-N6)-dimethyltransferase
MDITKKTMKRNLGQNFLIDNKVAEREVIYADISKDDVVLEIGPGKGIITKLLSFKAKKVIAIELDKNLYNNLKKTIPDNVELINDDAVKVDFNTLPHFNKIVSNLPFQISSPITFKILNHYFSLAILIYQKEFANRLIANPGSKDYSRLTVGVYYKARCKILETIPKTCFSPQPRVDSCIIELSPRKQSPFTVLDEKLFFDLTKNLFNHRRKKIKNILVESYKFKLDGIPYLENRVEELLPEQIANLSNIIFNKI